MDSNVAVFFFFLGCMINDVDPRYMGCFKFDIEARASSEGESLGAKSKVVELKLAYQA